MSGERGIGAINQHSPKGGVNYFKKYFTDEKQIVVSEEVHRHLGDCHPHVDIKETTGDEEEEATLLNLPEGFDQLIRNENKKRQRMEDK